MLPVLVVESDPTLQVMLHITLTAAGYHSVVCDDGLAGLAHARMHHPALILLDMHLPTVAGVTAIRVLRNMPTTQKIPIIAMSLDRDHPHELRRIPNVDILAKPFVQDDLLRLVAAHTRPAGVHPRHRSTAQELRYAVAEAV